MSNYSDLLRDPRWQRRRLEILSKTDFHCDECGSGEKTLNVHHLRYRKGAKPWEYEDQDLRALCEDCHEQVHALKKRLDIVIDKCSVEVLERIVGYAEGYGFLLSDTSYTLVCESHDHCIGVSDAISFPGIFADAIKRVSRLDRIYAELLFDIFGQVWDAGSAALNVHPGRLVTSHSVAASPPIRDGAEPDASSRLRQLKERSRTTRLEPEELSEYLALTREKRSPA